MSPHTHRSGWDENILQCSWGCGQSGRSFMAVWVWVVQCPLWGCIDRNGFPSGLVRKESACSTGDCDAQSLITVTSARGKGNTSMFPRKDQWWLIHAWHRCVHLCLYIDLHHLADTRREIQLASPFYKWEEMGDQRMYTQLVWEGLGFGPHRSLWTIASRGPLAKGDWRDLLVKGLALYFEQRNKTNGHWLTYCYEPST